MSQLLEMETHAPKVLFLEPFRKCLHFWHTDAIDSAGRASQKTSRLLVMMVLKSLSDSNIPFAHSFWVVSISFHNLEIISEIRNCTFETKVPSRSSPRGQKETTGNSQVQPEVWSLEDHIRSKSQCFHGEFVVATNLCGPWNLGHVSLTASK